MAIDAVVGQYLANLRFEEAYPFLHLLDMCRVEFGLKFLTCRVVRRLSPSIRCRNGK
jgi:hypothetical protein